MNRICLYSLVGLSLLVSVAAYHPAYAQERPTSSTKRGVSASRARVVIDREKTSTASFIAIKVILPDKCQVSALEIPNPNRLVFDFTNTTARKSEPFTLLPNDAVSSIRFGSHSDKMRVVIDLKTSQFPFYEWKAGPKQLLIKILESGKRPESIKQPTSTPTASPTRPTPPTVVGSAVPTTAVTTQAPKAAEPTLPKLPDSTDRVEQHQEVTAGAGAENLLHPVKPDLQPTISVRSLGTPTDVKESALIGSPVPSLPAQPGDPTAATVSPVATVGKSIPPPTLTPITSKTPTPIKTSTPTQTPVPTKTSTPTHTPSATATSLPPAAPSPTAAPTPPPLAPTASTNAAPLARTTEAPAALAPQATSTAVPTQQPITDFHLLNYRFDYLEPGRIPVLKLVLDKSRPQAQISKIDAKTYTIDILNCSLSRPGLALAQYPPAEFRGFLLVSSTSTDTRLTVTINVDAGTTLGTFVRNNEIWVKRL